MDLASCPTTLDADDDGLGRIAPYRHEATGVTPSYTSAPTTPTAPLPEGMTRLRRRIGALTVEARVFPTQRVTQIKVAAGTSVLIVPLQGGAQVVTYADAGSLNVHTGILLARPETVSILWRAGSRGLVFWLPRHQVQAVASELFGGARRLAAAHRKVSLPVYGTLAAVIDQCVDVLGNGADDVIGGDRIDDQLYRALAGNLLEEMSADEIFPQSRSITLAMREVCADYGRSWDAESLASVAGVTVPTLRKGFRACLGISIGNFIQRARLQWAHQCLASGNDSRPLTAVAASVGYQTAGSFSRAYQHLFGEAPSQTRSRAVHNNWNIVQSIID